MNKLIIWYKELSPRKKMLVHFFIQWIYWFLADISFDKIWPDDEPETILSRIFKATWMALWMTIIFNWKTFKQLFRKKHETS